MFKKITYISIGFIICYITLYIFKNVPFQTNKEVFLQRKLDSLNLKILKIKAKSSYFASNRNEKKVNNKQKNDSILKEIHRYEIMIVSKAKSFNELKIVVKNIKVESPNLFLMPCFNPLMPGSFKRFSSGFGYREHPIKGTFKLHTGLDIAANAGVNVYCTAVGKVIYSGFDRSYGNHIIVEHNFGFKTLYGHLSKILVTRSQSVKAGEIIGLVGSTGASTGPHLHYEIIKNGNKINPINFINILADKLGK